MPGDGCHRGHRPSASARNSLRTHSFRITGAKPVRFLLGAAVGILELSAGRRRHGVDEHQPRRAHSKCLMAPTLRRDTVAVHPWLRRHLLAFPCREHIDPNSTISGSNMSLRAPGDGATPMTRSQSEGRAERHGGGAGAADHVPVGADVEREVRDDQQDRGDRREPEERGDLDFGPPASPSTGRHLSDATGARADPPARSKRVRHRGHQSRSCSVPRHVLGHLQHRRSDCCPYDASIRSDVTSPPTSTVQYYRPGYGCAMVRCRRSSSRPRTNAR